MQNYETLKTLHVTQTEEFKLSLDSESHKDIPHLEQNFMSLPELTPEKIAQLQENDTFCNNILQHMHYNMNKN